MFRVRSIPFPSRSAEGVHSLSRTRRPVYSGKGLQGLSVEDATPSAFANESQQSSRRSARQPAPFSPSRVELSNQCSAGLRWLQR